MKKIVAALVTGLVLSSAAVTTASAEQHEVQSGENLWDIANKYNTTVDKLVQVNDLKTTVIQPKQTLYINNTYVVQQGDTLLSIAKEHQVSLEELKEWNDLDSELIVIGQKLEIQGVAVDQTVSEAPKAKEEQPAAKKEEAQATQPAPEQQTSSNKEDSSNKTKEQKPEGKTISVTSTAYTASCDGCSGVTATGIDLNKDPNAKVIAVDPSVIPLGTKVHVEGYGYAIAGDTGGAIKGNKIDVHVPSKGEATNWGVRTVNVTIVE